MNTCFISAGNKYQWINMFLFSVTPPANGLMAIPLQPTTSTTAAPCIDKDQYCSGWKNLCYTDEYVKFNCKKSCTFCK